MERVTRFLVHSLTCPKLNVNHRAKPVIYRGVEHHLKVPVRYCLQWRKTTVGWFQRATWRNRRVQLESIALLQNCKMKQKNVVLKCKKSFFLRKLTEISNLILCLSEIPKIFMLAFLSEDWKKVVRLKKCPLYGFWFSSISLWLYKCVKGKHIEKRRDQTCLSFSARSPG